MFRTRITRRWLGAGAVLLGLGTGCSHRCQDPSIPICEKTCGGRLASGHAPAGFAQTEEPGRPDYGLRSNDRFAAVPPEEPASPVVAAERPTPAAVPVQEHASIPRATEGRYSAPDVTARPEWQHAIDYSWLVGELHYSSAKNQWRLRYASIDQEDRYGGSVTLDGAGGSLRHLRTGMIVRVAGRLVNPESREISPHYMVRDLEPITK